MTEETLHLGVASLLGGQDPVDEAETPGRREDAADSDDMTNIGPDTQIVWKPSQNPLCGHSCPNCEYEWEE